MGKNTGAEVFSEKKVTKNFMCSFVWRTVSRWQTQRPKKYPAFRMWKEISWSQWIQRQWEEEMMNWAKFWWKDSFCSDTAGWTSKDHAFYNGGATLTTEGSDSLEDLKSLEAQGVTIKTCGTCLNYYGLTEKLCVGEVTNMYDIVETMAKASKVIKPWFRRYQGICWHFTAQAGQ